MQKRMPKTYAPRTLLMCLYSLIRRSIRANFEGSQSKSYLHEGAETLGLEKNQDGGIPSVNKERGPAANYMGTFQHRHDSGWSWGLFQL